MDKIAYVCTNYNGAKVSIAAAHSFIQQFGDQAIVVIVDNGSDIESVEELIAFAHGKSNVTVVDTRTNGGYFAGLNRGLDFLNETSELPTWVFVGNNDLIFTHGIASALNERAAHLRSFPVVAPNLITLDGVRQNPHVIEGISWQRKFLYAIYYRSYIAAILMRKVSALTKSLFKRSDTAQWSQGCRIWAGHGACYLLTPRFFEIAQRLDNFSFLYFEEAFLALQVQKAGEAIWYEPTLQIEHLCNGTIGKLPGRKVWQFSREAYHTYRKKLREMSTEKGRRL